MLKRMETLKQKFSNSKDLNIAEQPEDRYGTDELYEDSFNESYEYSASPEPVGNQNQDGLFEVVRQRSNPHGNGPSTVNGDVLAVGNDEHKLSRNVW